MQNIANNIPSGVLGNTVSTIMGGDVSNGLKEALNTGVTSGVQQLGQQNGFLNNNVAKILYPNELQKVDNVLRSIGMGSVADEGLKVLNRAAEDAVKEATPIFTKAIINMSFSDATNILMGGNTAATDYLKNSTSSSLIQAFSPKVQSSISKVGADKIWNKIITTYNAVPMVQKVNPDLTGYITEQTVDGLFKMVAQKETAIRGNVSERTTPLLQKVFSQQDKK